MMIRLRACVSSVGKKRSGVENRVSSLRIYSTASVESISSTPSGSNEIADSSKSVQANHKEDLKKFAKIGNIRSDGHSLRFYKQTLVLPHKRVWSGGEEQVFKLQLEERDVLTPAEAPMWFPTYGLASAVSCEWQSQKKYIRPFSMPLTTLTCTAIDQLPLTRQTVVGSLLQHLQTDTACFRGNPITEPELVSIQEKLHDPLIEWFAKAFNCKVNIITQGDLFSPEQPEKTVNILRWYLHSLSDWQLAGLDSVTSSTRSLITSLALMHYQINVETAIAAGRAEEEYQAKTYGDVPLGHDIDRANANLNVASSSLFLHLLPHQATVPNLP